MPCVITTSAVWARQVERREQPGKPRWARTVFVSDPRARRGRPFV